MNNINNKYICFAIQLTRNVSARKMVYCFEKTLKNIRYLSFFDTKVAYAIKPFLLEGRVPFNLYNQ